MGFTPLNTNFLLSAKQSCWEPGNVITLGRQNAFMISRDWERIAKTYNLESSFEAKLRTGQSLEWMDEFFYALGASKLSTMDAADFEGADILHDLNCPIDRQYHEQYDSVIDGGTLEHVFNAPVAFANVMNLLRVGGSFFGVLPANNWCGHGFYQFSPELVFRLFCKENGFEVVQLLVAPVFSSGKWLDGPTFSVADPEEVKGRVQISGRNMLSLLVWARKTVHKVPFQNWPQQSDYVAAWAAKTSEEFKSRNLIINKLSYLISRFTGIFRILRRLRDNQLWNREAMKNPHLTRHTWVGR